MKMNVETEIWLALKMDYWPKVRKMAALVAYDYWMASHRHGRFAPYEAQLDRLANRFHLGDWLCALSAHYPIS
jgi:hypothetical protein